ncbi:MAG: hypothetical protein WAL29_00025 [Bacteroidales bacterium]
MNSRDIKLFIRSKSDLFWYTPDDKKEEIAPELLVETILNYGSLDDIRTLMSIMGKKEMSRILNSATGRKRMNYFPEIYNFFSLYFKRNA